MEKIFVSYKRADYDIVSALVKRIEKALNEKCWIDIDGIESTVQFRSKICNAIDAASIVLFMHSKHHLDIDFENDWTIKELDYAQQTHKKVVLVKLDDSPLRNVFLFEFGSKNNIYAQEEIQIKKLISELKEDLGYVPKENKPAQKKTDQTQVHAALNDERRPLTQRLKPASYSFKKISIHSGDYYVNLTNPGDKSMMVTFLSTLPGIQESLARDYVNLTPLNVIRKISKESALAIIEQIQAIGGDAVLFQEQQSQEISSAPVKRKTPSRSSTRSKNPKTYTLILQSFGSRRGFVSAFLLRTFGLSSFGLLPITLAHGLTYEKASSYKKALELIGATVVLK